MSDPTADSGRGTIEAESLVVRFLDGLITDAEFTRLEALLETDETVRRAFVELTAQARELCDIEASSIVTAPSSSPRGRGFGIAVSLVAAGLVIAAAVSAVYLMVISSVDPQPPAEPERRAPIVATLIDATGLVLVDSGPANPGDEYAAGVYAIESGSAEFQLVNGANLRLYGDTRIDVRDPLRASMTRGMAAFDCPPSAAGYTVELPEGVEVIDLGTRFSVSVDPAGGATVRVDEGRVRIKGDTTVELAAGEGAAVSGRVVRRHPESLATGWRVEGGRIVSSRNVAVRSRVSWSPSTDHADRFADGAMYDGGVSDEYSEQNHALFMPAADYRHALDLVLPEPTDLSLLAAYVSAGDDAGSREPDADRTTAFVEFYVDRGSGLELVGVVEPRDTDDVGQFDAVGVTGRWSGVRRVRYVFVSTGPAYQGPRVGEVVAIVAPPGTEERINLPRARVGDGLKHDPQSP